jgi:phosphoribosylformylglycinamidine synthase
MEVVLQEKSRAKAEAQMEDMCRRLLANPVIERYRFELEEISS